MSKMDILSLSVEARLAKEKDDSIVNAIIGMYLDEEGILGFRTVKETLESLKSDKLIPYGQTTGGLMFEEAVFKWVLGHQINDINNSFHSLVVATPGGSGAINVALSTFGSVNTPILVSDIRWRYDYFAQAVNKQLIEYELFDNQGKYNLVSLENTINEIQSDDFIFIINDPCHNPTGYCLSEKELKQIINLLNKQTKKGLIVYDIAYQDFHPEGMESARNNLALLTKLNNNIRVSITFSGSKTFGVYGIRLGALINLYPNQEERDNHKSQVLENVLGKWSTAPSTGVELIDNILTTNLIDNFTDDLNLATKTLRKRGEIFVAEAKAVGLEHYPYKGGFFILLKTNNQEDNFNDLQKAGIYVVPISGGLRISLSSVKISEISGLAKRIHNIVSRKN